MTEHEKQHLAVDGKRAYFRMTQKGLLYDAAQQKFLILKAAADRTLDPQFAAVHKYWFATYGPWDLPGGHVDRDEHDLSSAFAREIREECGVEVGDAVACYTTVLENPHASAPAIAMMYLVHYSGEIVLSDEHEHYQWMSAEEVDAHEEIKPWMKEAVRAATEMIALQEADGRWKRCVADFDNYKKRQAQTQKDLAAYAAEGVIADLLPVVDNFHAATDHIPADQADNPWVTGIMYIQQQMEKVIEDKGVTRMDVKVGDAFDPERMDAVKENEDEEIDGDAVVAKVIQPGYMIGTKVARVARVAVTQRAQ